MQSRWQTVAMWVVALALALSIDGPVARAVSPFRNTVKYSVVADEIREGGHAGMTFVAILLLIALHPQKWRAVSLLAGSAALAGVLRAIIALAAGRTRPVVAIEPFTFFHLDPTVNALLHAKNLSFPSGHATLAFVSAAALSHLLGKGHWLFYGGAVLVGIERIAESAHYVSDVVAGALLGVVAFKLALRLHTYLWEQFDRTNELQVTAA